MGWMTSLCSHETNAVSLESYTRDKKQKIDQLWNVALRVGVNGAPPCKGLVWYT